MQTPMLKYSLLVYHQAYASFLEQLRELGLLHVVEHKGVVVNEALLEQSLRCKNLLKQFEAQVGKDVPAAASGMSREDIIESYEQLKAEQERLAQNKAQTEKELEKLRPWGDYNPTTLAALQAEGVYVHLFKCPLRELQKAWMEDLQFVEIAQEGSMLYFAIISDEATLKLEAETVQLGDKSKSALEAELQTLEQKLQEAQVAQKCFVLTHTEDLRLAYGALMQELNLQKVLSNTDSQAEGKVMVLEGWCPEENCAALNTYLDTQMLYYQVSKPTEADKVPVKLKNNAFAKLYEFVGELYDLPNYFEIDLTPFFAPFFLLFFGLCLGDSGYGLLLIAAAVYFKRKAPVHIKPVMNLLLFLGISTVLMGLLTGTFFGINLLEVDLPWLNAAKAYMLDSNKLFYTALIIGVVQILFGMIIKAIGQVQRFGWPSSLSTWGWLSILIGLGSSYLLTEKAKLIDPAIGQILYYIFGGIGVLCIFILNDLKRNPLINIGAGLWDTYNMATGLLGDTLSYIRLFALSISGAVMGLVFNDLAISITSDMPIVISQVVMLFILLFGHGLNIFMSTLGAFVHPMRLTFVEFYKNSGFEGGGKKYKPFANYAEEKKIL